MEDADRRTRLRRFAIGGVLGAAGVIATMRRSRRRREAVAGLAAFEDAPCFLEETQPYRETGGETLTGTSNPT